jgi:hypothetical protein
MLACFPWFTMTALVGTLAFGASASVPARRSSYFSRPRCGLDPLMQGGSTDADLAGRLEANLVIELIGTELRFRIGVEIKLSLRPPDHF